MRTKLESKTTAWIITGLVVLFAALLGGRASLLLLRNEAWRYFVGGYDGPETLFSGIYYDFKAITEDAVNLVTVVERYQKPSEPVMEVYINPKDRVTAQVRTDATRIVVPNSVYDVGLYANRLRTSLGQLDALLETLPLDERDRAYHRELMASIESRYMTIENSPYNTLAADFNRQLDRQPAGIIAAVTGIERLELYQ